MFRLSPFESESGMLFPTRTQLQIVPVDGDHGVTTLKKVFRNDGVLHRVSGNVSPPEFSTFDFFPISENGISQLSTRKYMAVVEQSKSYNSLCTKFLKIEKSSCSLNCFSKLPRSQEFN